jgi:mercuric ion transport protein
MHPIVMTVKEDGRMPGMQRSQYLVAAGGLLGAVAASSCCIVPLILFSLGVSGAWIGNLTRLAPYQPYFVAITVAALVCGYWLVYRSSQAACVGGEACGWPGSNRFVKIGLVLATVLVVLALSFDFIAPLIFRT